MQEDQKPTMPTGEVENKKKATKLPLKAKVTKRQFSVERPRDTVYAISVVSDAIREHMQAFVDENGGRKACCHRISIHFSTSSGLYLICLPHFIYGGPIFNERHFSRDVTGRLNIVSTCLGDK